MPAVADCLRQHGDSFLQNNSRSVPGQVRRVLSAITRCRTGELGSVVYDCTDCGREHWVGRSCGNRHCPGCQHERTQNWLKKQTGRLLPVQHFLLTFTVPREVRSLLRSEPRAGYDAIFTAGRQTIRDLLANPKWLGTPHVGFLGVLHTWGRDPMVYHPHVHFVVPGGGVSRHGSKWLSTPQKFLFPEPCASPVYRQKFREVLREQGLENAVDPDVWHRWWEVDVQPVGNGQAVLKYLAPYIHRVAICDSRIEECDEDSVTYRFTPSGSKTSPTRKVSGEEFVAGFVQHVLPKQYQKVRYYGWMSSGSRFRIEQIRWLVWLWLGWTYWLGSGVVVPDRERPEPLLCEHCGGALRLKAVISEDGRVLVNHALTYLDSG